MTFIEAVQALKAKECRAITRKSWPKRNIYCTSPFIHEGVGSENNIIIENWFDNFLADDWEMVPFRVVKKELSITFSGLSLGVPENAKIYAEWKE